MRKVSLSQPDITDSERNAVLEVLQTPYLSFGPKISEFEQKMAGYIGTKHAIAVNSGTSALHLCIKALGITEGDEVITTPFSFIASSNCLLYEKAVPVFVDINPGTLNLDTRQIEAKITPKTKAILPVHVFGLPCNMDDIIELAKKHNLFILEDSCEAIGATYRGKKVGSFGEASVFGFYPNKQITTGEGGIIVTDNDEINRLCRSLRNQGREEGDEWLVHQRLGHNYRLSDINCALGVAQLGRINELLSKRQKVADLYDNLLKEVPEIRLPEGEDHATKSWFVYVIILNENFTREQRNKILGGLKRKGIGCSNYFPPIHLQPFYVKNFGYQPGSFPIAESICGRTIALPFHGGLTEEDIFWVVETLTHELKSTKPLLTR